VVPVTVSLAPPDKLVVSVEFAAGAATKSPIVMEFVPLTIVPPVNLARGKEMPAGASPITVPPLKVMVPLGSGLLDLRITFPPFAMS
jgi:hypothetical protein